MGTSTKAEIKKPILAWQYRSIVKELLLLQGHGADPDCPCKTDGEMCVRKHLLTVEALCEETVALEPDDTMAAMLSDMAMQCKKYVALEEKKLCEVEVKEDYDLAQMARNLRKKIEEYSLACPLKVKKAAPAAAPAPAPLSTVRIMEPPAPAPATTVKIAGSCEATGTCKIKVKAVDQTEGETGSLAGLPNLVNAVLEQHHHQALTPSTFALGPTGSKYEFKYHVIDANKVVTSHDPFTFEPVPGYPQELQPRLRGRAATQQQVSNMAARLDPDALLREFQSLDRGAPIVGPDNVVESGNGRVMAVIRAAKEHPEVYDAYRKALAVRAQELGVKLHNKLKVPILVRERITETDRVKFVEEANAASTIERSAIEVARTDANKITPEMLSELRVAENESLDEALKDNKNKTIVSRFLAKLPANEQARTVDSRGVLSQDGVRRIVMAMFVSAFSGDAGLHLAERFFESTDVNVRNAFNGIAGALPNLAKMEMLCRKGLRPAEYSIAADLARAVTVFSVIKRTPGMNVETYMGQHQMFERELSEFQETILKALGEHGRSGRRIANILNAYAGMVLEQPAPQQVSMMAQERPTKAQLFQHALSHAESPVTGTATLFEPPAPAPMQFMRKFNGRLFDEIMSHVVKLPAKVQEAGLDLVEFLNAYTGLALTGPKMPDSEIRRAYDIILRRLRGNTLGIPIPTDPNPSRLDQVLLMDRIADDIHEPVTGGRHGFSVPDVFGAWISEGLESLRHAVKSYLNSLFERQMWPAPAPGKQPWVMTRREFRFYQNKPKYDAILKAIEAGKRLVVGTAYRGIEIRRPEHIRLTGSGEMQVPSGKTWIYLTGPQVDALAAQAGMPSVPFDEQVYHEAEVRQALEQGLPVPAAVLADYPDLKPPVPPEFDEGSIATLMPRAAPGFAEAGLQSDIFGGIHRHIPRSKGSLLQGTMDDYLKLAEYRVAQGYPPAPPADKAERVCDALTEARDIHEQYLHVPEDPKTGSYPWHQRWINVYNDSLEICPCALAKRRK